ncbi:hypothetical protein EDD85DRAFT_798148 [Armillaria nabsnona]|nr:hypothetical protein EDD85DRAFT_798148 [Armillaria nabsnona]
MCRSPPSPGVTPAYSPSTSPLQYNIPVTAVVAVVLHAVVIPSAPSFQPMSNQLPYQGLQRVHTLCMPAICVDVDVGGSQSIGVRFGTMFAFTVGSVVITEGSGVIVAGDYAWSTLFEGLHGWWEDARDADALKKT